MKFPSLLFGRGYLAPIHISVKHGGGRRETRGGVHDEFCLPARCNRRRLPFLLVWICSGDFADWMGTFATEPLLSVSGQTAPFARKT